LDFDVILILMQNFRFNEKDTVPAGHSSCIQKFDTDNASSINKQTHIHIANI